MSTTGSTILIDAYSQIFRVFYAIAHLSRRDGFPTNALFGFARLLMQLEKEFTPTAGAMFFDCGKPAFRLELAPEYKSNRPPMPEALKLQMPLLRKMAEIFGWNVCECTGYEADDLIGAAVKNSPGKQFAIISSDKDLSQLVDEYTSMLIPSRSGSGFERRTATEVITKFGVAPDQIIDYLSMLGDSSDAITGIPGVGPKTAASVLQSCHSLSNFFANPQLLNNIKTREKLLNAEELLQRNRQLITLRTIWPENELGSLEQKLCKNTPDWQQLAELAREYELKSILREIPASMTLTSSPAKESTPTPEADNPEDLFSWSAAREQTQKPVEDLPQADVWEQGQLF